MIINNSLDEKQHKRKKLTYLLVANKRRKIHVTYFADTSLFMIYSTYSFF